MRGLLRIILRILDGTPQAVAGTRQRGQSLVELALIAPLLIIMIFGIAEIGWYANHYMILLDTTRNGARFGTTLTGDLSPDEWNESSSIHPVVYDMQDRYSVDLIDDTGDNPDLVIPNTGGQTYREQSRICDTEFLPDIGFFQAVSCQMLNSLAPLTLKGRLNGQGEAFSVFRERLDRNGNTTDISFYPDDMVVSVFALQMINNTPDPEALSNEPNAYRVSTKYLQDWCIQSDGTVIEDASCATQDLLYEEGYRLRVVGRYPARANECNVYFLPANPASNQSPFIPTLEQTGVDATDLTVQDENGFDVLTSDGRRIYWPDGTFTYREFFHEDPFNYIPTYDTGEDKTVNDTDGNLTLGNLNIDAGEEDLYGDGIVDHIPQTEDFGGEEEYNIELQGGDIVPEMQMGFVWTGQHIVEREVEIGGTLYQLACLGSEWSDERVENIMNLPNFLAPYDLPPLSDPSDWPDNSNATADAYEVELSNWLLLMEDRGLIKFYNDNGISITPPERAGDNDDWKDNLEDWYGDVTFGTGIIGLNDTQSQRRRQLPTSGVVLVEMHWGHDLLLNFPFLDPIITMFGDPQRITISVWAAFPAPTVEPNFTYNLVTN
jgi:hypothetical protein